MNHPKKPPGILHFRKKHRDFHLKTQSPMPQTERTLAMIKPDALQNGHALPILKQLTEAGFRISALKMTRLSRREASLFYAEHTEKPFFEFLIRYMTSGPILAAVLEKENAIGDLRTIVGKTDPKEAAPGTIRQQYGLDGTRNAIHASDSPESARRECAFYFTAREIF